MIWLQGFWPKQPERLGEVAISWDGIKYLLQEEDILQRSGVGNLEFILGHGSFRMSIKYTDRDVEQPVGHISLKFRGGIQMRYKNLSVFCTYTEFKATGMSEITKKVYIN